MDFSCLVVLFLGFVLTYIRECECTATQLLISDEEIEEYTKCLNHRERKIMNAESISAHAIVVQQNEAVALPCFECMNPALKSLYRRRKITWSRHGMNTTWVNSQNISSGNNSFVVNSQNISSGNNSFVIHSERKSLIINQVQKHHVGFYFCIDTNKNELLTVYFLDIVMNISTIAVTATNTGKFPPLPNETVYKDFGVKMVTDFRDWSDCDRCGGIGEDKGYGECLIQKAEKTQNSSQDKQLNTVEKWLTLFSEGIPCLSSLVPVTLKAPNTSQELKLRNTVRPDQVRVRVCKMSCPPPRKGRVRKEVLENGTEIVAEVIGPNEFEIDQEKPFVPETVVRLAAKRFTGQSITLQCPALHVGTVFWKKENQTFNSFFLYKRYKHRILLTGEFKLRIKNMTLEDSALYSCWTWDGMLLLTNNVTVVKAPLIRAIKPFIMSVAGFVALTALVVLIVAKSLSMRKNVHKEKNKAEEKKKEKETDLAPQVQANEAEKQEIEQKTQVAQKVVLKPDKMK